MGEKGTKEKQREKKFGTPKLYIGTVYFIIHGASILLLSLINIFSKSTYGNKKCYFIISRMIMHVSESMNF